MFNLEPESSSPVLGFPDPIKAGINGMEDGMRSLSNLEFGAQSAIEHLMPAVEEESELLLASDGLGVMEGASAEGVDVLTGSKILQTIETTLSSARNTLQEFAKSPDFNARINLAFGDTSDAEKVKALKEDWLEGNIGLPPIKVISSALINGGNGAFGGATNTIYLSREFVTENFASSQAVADVFLEELGHYIDSQINLVDAVGDEGEIFSAVVQGKELSEAYLQTLKSEDDMAVVVIDGLVMSVEQSSSWTTIVGDWSSGSIDWLKKITLDSDRDNGIDVDFGSGSPGEGLPSDYFLIGTYTATDLKADRDYEFKVRADDGFQLFITSNRGESWTRITPSGWQQAYGDPKEYTYTPTTDGEHHVFAFMYEAKGDAYLDISWEAESEGTIYLADFTGWVMPEKGVALRNSPDEDDRSSLAEPYKETLTFDAWTYGDTVTDYQLGTPDNRWFRIAGTDYWVPSAYIFGNPPDEGSSGNGSSDDNGYYSELNALSDNQWEDKINSAVDLNSINDDTNSDISKLYRDLSNDLLGQYFPITGAFISDDYYAATGGGYGYHGGIDLGGDIFGNPVKSLVDGTVVVSSPEWGLLSIKSDDGKHYIYMHLSEFSVNYGETVNAGEIIGKAGSTAADAPHLHFEISKNPWGALQRPAAQTKEDFRAVSYNPLKEYWELKNG